MESEINFDESSKELTNNESPEKDAVLSFGPNYDAWLSWRRKQPDEVQKKQCESDYFVKIKGFKELTFVPTMNNYVFARLELNENAMEYAEYLSCIAEAYGKLKQKNVNLGMTQTEIVQVFQDYSPIFV